jgi:phosphatidylserine/phosphatidylglycerophosphate/cardiolipin synthase-like enzyme
MRHGRSDGLHPLIKFAVATMAVGACFVWLWGEFDRRVEKGFAVGQKPVPIIAPAASDGAQLARAVERSVAPASAPAIDVYFSPNGSATDAIVRELGRAKQRVRVQAYSFTSAPIAKALVEAKRRGVDVVVVLDDSQQTDKYSSATFLHNGGVPVHIDSQHAIAHNKVILVDADTVITGSFNFSRAAEERNAENLLVIRDGGLAAKYQANFQNHLAHSRPYQR